jgi:Flp pilus assembly protein TadG
MEHHQKVIPFPSPTARRAAEAGQALIMVTLGIVFLFGVLGLVVDLGYAYYLKQVAQAAADSAVLAGTTAANGYGSSRCGITVLCQNDAACPANPPNPPNTNFDVACLYGKKNGSPNQSISMSGGTGNPPNVSVAANYWMTATATQTMPLGFLSVMGFRTASVSARATSALVGAAADGCIWVLDPIADGALTMNGGSLIQSDCSIHVNSRSSQALNATGGAVLHASEVDLVGGARLTGGSVVTPTPTTGAAPAADPLANLPNPSFGGCNYTNVQLGGGVNNLQPGVYCGGIKISAQAVVNFAPGTYILNGGGMQVTSSFATVNGTGVFFYNTSSGYAFSSVAIASGATVNLTAPTAGTYRGILLYQDRNISSSATTAFGGGSNEYYRGTIYLPNGNLQYVGGSSSQNLTVALIAKDLTIAGNAYMSKDAQGASTGIVQSTTMLVE